MAGPLDIMLKSLMSSAEFIQLENKNWENISRLLPNTTPRQVKQRYDELLKQQITSQLSCTTLPSSKSSQSSKSSKTDTDDQKSSRPGSGRSRDLKMDRDLTSRKVRADTEDFGPTMVIHVCDEAKNLKQDFSCPRDLLVHEMKYFAEYLSTDAQRWEEVDISVHCDVQIFDWLMKYVKRFTKEVPDPPKLADLKPNNVISILISSDFLKMDYLVQECIGYCHKNMSAIVATPCNMNCINDKLVTRIADMFTHNEVDEVKDKKDKFKSKLFAKKIEKLFEPDAVNLCSPEKAITLFRCSVCHKLLTKTLEKKLKCATSRTTIDRVGNLSYYHTRDPSWDVNDYLLEQKAQLKTWRDVYWRLWGTINFLQCSRCKEYFTCTELGHCKYHPEKAVFEEKIGDKKTTSVIGTYPCCDQKTLRFDPLGQQKGCRVRDHVVVQTVAKKGETAENTNDSSSRVYDDLLAHRSAITVPYQGQSVSNENELNVFAMEESACGIQDTVVGEKKEGSNTDGSKAEPKLQALTVEEELALDYPNLLESDDEVGDEEPARGVKSKTRRVTVDPHAILVDGPEFNTTKNRKWDTSRSMRWNQDTQRDDDQRRMREIVSYLTKLRLPSEKLEKYKQKEYAGGLYMKIEAQWKAANTPTTKQNPNVIRAKTRVGQMRSTVSA
ncbi:uncharacterized protein KIAA1841 homolog isoform X1 [Lingula anatina]|uniref:Uncharacterized protein KIAA1841 homolog isoform X1 n=1 Tax=Lingula anatina TaxID=7574 RepID=A0A1S3H979_LINAN|nr:uncharacterized protein KIAA1841 homolog isoform X1 [Lingula anatina]|eukprot:XP_013382557.1 uncharacterized protein KIAA1841 homolog isoform X1 [Lingula anatina]